MLFVLINPLLLFLKFVPQLLPFVNLLHTFHPFYLICLVVQLFPLQSLRPSRVLPFQTLIIQLIIILVTLRFVLTLLHLITMPFILFLHNTLHYILPLTYPMPGIFFFERRLGHLPICIVIIFLPLHPSLLHILLNMLQTSIKHHPILLIIFLNHLPLLFYISLLRLLIIFSLILLFLFKNLVFPLLENLPLYLLLKTYLN